MTFSFIYFRAVPIWMCVFVCFSSSAQEIKIIKADNLYQMVEERSKKLRIINFWATWCKPCVEELPQFEQMNKKENIEVMLVSLDFLSTLQTRVSPFIRKKELKSALYLLDETDYDPIINRLDKKWSGAIPATIIKKPGSEGHFFYEKQFHEGELEQTIQKILKNKTNN